MALELILPILQLFKYPITKYIVTPIKRHVSYTFKCDSKVEGLEERVEKLQCKRDRLQDSVDEARRNGGEIYGNVTEWLGSADKAIGTAEELVVQKERAKNKCLMGLCPNFKSRYQLSKKADKQALAIDKQLQNAESLGTIANFPPVQQIIEPSIYSREALPSRVAMLNQLMDAVRDPNLNMIGVHGMGGVGKTTLAKEVQAKSTQEKLFETVVLVAVSQTPELRRIQIEIADFLGMKFDMESVAGRASLLHKRLKNAKVLIILDDLWQKFELNAIGIPSQDESKGCKIMITSRNRDLLSNEMGAQKLFSLEALKEEETLSLFEMSVAEAKDPKFRAIATEIAKKCAGLPLLIQMVATELRKKEQYVWNAKLNQLSALGDEEIYEKVYKVLESSYEALPGKDIKSFFLLCALFGQSNIRIQYLLTHGMGLGLFKNIHSVEGARDKVLSWIDNLKAKSLLLDGDMFGFVKMHDVVRDTALSIASRDQHAFIGAVKVTLRDWPNRDCTRISLPFCDVSELPVGLDCPEAELFFLFTEDLSLEIPDSFFNGIKKLKVVDLTGMRMVSFPWSIRLLTSLQTLCLHGCRLDNLAILGELKQLELLSFADSEIVELPRDIEQLTRLKLLDLRNCSNLCLIPAGVFLKLCSLEELYVLNSFVRWDARDNVRLVELESLCHLVTLEIEIENPKWIPLGFKGFNGLKKYKISIGSGWNWAGNYEKSKTLKLQVEAGFDLEDVIEMLLRKTEDLYLDGVRGTENVFYEGFPQLKHMHVANDSDIQHLIKSTTRVSCNAFPMLESLYLKNLQRLEKLCDGKLGMGSFGELQILKICTCRQLKRIFSCSFAKCLPQLQEMEVEYCANIEAIAFEESDDVHNDNEVIEFTRLNSMKLKWLPHLLGFCKIKEGTDQMGVLFNKMVSFPNLTSLEVKECNSLKQIFTASMVSFPNLTSLEVEKCNSLKQIFTASMVKCLIQLKKLSIGYCESVEEIIQSKKIEEIEEDSTKIIVFPKLDYLWLYDLQNVKRFSSCYTVEFPFLRELTIVICKEMSNFAPKLSSADREEYLFNEMVTFPNLEKMTIEGMNNFKYLWDEQFIADDSFFKLKSLAVSDCSKLSVVFPSNISSRFQRVEWLYLSSCGRVEEIYQRIDFEEIKNAFSLQRLQITGLPSLKHIWNKDSCEASAFENLQSVEVEYCKALKYVFPASMGCGLVQLRHLKVGYCDSLEVIIPKEKDEASPPSFQFPELTDLQLLSLDELKSLYDGPHTLECLKLKSLEVQGCFNIFFDKFISNLEELTIDERGFDAIHQKHEFSVELCSKLKKVTLNSLESERSIGIVFGFLRGIRSLETFVFEDSSSEGILGSDDALYQRPIGEERRHLLRLKHLELRTVQKLKHITTEKESQLNLIVQHLQTLKINDCPHLINIASSLASLENLTILHVDFCYEVTNLVTALTAKSMVQLMELKVVNCEMIEEIVATDGDGPSHDVIIFNKLKLLELCYLRKLGSFCSDKTCNFDFPLLEKVTVKGCDRMNIFCGGVLSTPKLQGILFEDEQQWEGNLNATLASRLREWVGELVGEGMTVYQNVESLELANNKFSSKALLASQIKSLHKLRVIVVRDCDSVQVVFDLEEGYAGARMLPRLIEMELSNLPMLTQICNKAPSGILDFTKLIVVRIENCRILKHAFTWPMASCLSQLQLVEVENCEMMESLIGTGEEEEDVAHVTFGSLEDVNITGCPSIQALISAPIHFTHLVTFSNLETLYLAGMDKLRYIWSSEEIISLKNLRSVEISNCPDLKYVFTVPVASGLHQLEELKIEECGVEVIIGNAKDETFENMVEDFSFQNLRSVEISNCPNLKYVFTVPVASGLHQLEDLKIKECGVEVIIGNAKDETFENMVEAFSFENLQSVEISNCLDLKYVFPASVASGLRQLQKLKIEKCGVEVIIRDAKDKTFGWLNLTHLVLYNCYNFIHFGFNIIKSIPEVEQLGLDHTCLKAIQIDGLPAVDFWLKLKKVIVISFGGRDIPVLFGFLKRICSLEHLIFHSCYLLEHHIFSSDDERDVGDDELEYFRTLRHLELINIKNLKHILNKEHSPFNPNIYAISVSGCQDLMNIAPSSACFQNLTTLHVRDCPKMTSLVTASTARTMVQLVELKVSSCGMLEEIVANDFSIVEHDVIVFSKLNRLELDYLHKLNSFCSGNYNLSFPLLEQVMVRGCSNLKIFCSGYLSTPTLQEIQVDLFGQQQWKGDLNATMIKRIGC